MEYEPIYSLYKKDLENLKQIENKQKDVLQNN